MEGIEDDILRLDEDIAQDAKRQTTVGLDAAITFARPVAEGSIIDECAWNGAYGSSMHDAEAGQQSPTWEGVAALGLVV